MLQIGGERFRLAIPIEDALAFALGQKDLGYADPDDGLRRVMGALVLDSLEYDEHWRAAAVARACLAEKWPACFAS